MAKINSKKKGDVFELKIAKAFTEKTNGKLVFRRPPLSGGWEPRLTTGDIFPIFAENEKAVPDLDFIVEVRKNELFTLDTILSDSSIVLKWYKEKQALYRDHATKYSLPYKSLVFVMSRNRLSPVVVYDNSFNPKKYFKFDREDPYIGLVSLDGKYFCIQTLDTFMSGLTFYENE